MVLSLEGGVEFHEFSESWRVKIKQNRRIVEQSGMDNFLVEQHLIDNRRGTMVILAHAWFENGTVDPTFQRKEGLSKWGCLRGRDSLWNPPTCINSNQVFRTYRLTWKAGTPVNFGVPSHVDEQQFRDTVLQYFDSDNHGHLEIRGNRLSYCLTLQTTLESRREERHLLSTLTTVCDDILEASHRVCTGLWTSSPTVVRIQSPSGVSKWT